MLPPIEPGLPVDERALAALARTRALGLHFLGHFVGVAAAENGDGATRLILEPPRPPGASSDGNAGSPVELSVLGDLACGSAVRSILGDGLRLGTTALAVDHLRHPAPGPLHGCAHVLWSDAEAMEGHARCDITDANGALVATATGWFVALSPPPGQALPPVPWETPSEAVPGLVEEELVDHERATLDAVRRSARLAGARGTGIPTQFVVPDRLPEPEADEVAWTLPVGPELDNRVNQMQGGALYAAAASASDEVLGHGWQVAGGAVQFLRPVDSPEVAVSARVVRRGRRVAFTAVEVAGPDRVALVGQFTHRPLGPVG